MSEAENKFVYVAHDLDGKIYGACADDPKIRSQVLDFVQQTIRSGGNLERLALTAYHAAAFQWGRRPLRLHAKLTTEGRARTPGATFRTEE